MFNITSLQARIILPVILSISLISTVAIAGKPVADPVVETTVSPLATDLQALVTQGNEVNVLLSAMSLNSDNSCSELGSAIASAESFTAAINTVTDSLTSPLSVDDDSLTALDDLSIISMGIASVLPVLSGDISAISTNADMADFQASLDTMLKLSDDIGTMADRILEMGDKILVMSDNIGLMADRILLTQQIQSSNMALTQASILTTQESMILLSVSIDTSAYNIPLNDLINTGNLLSQDMSNSPLTESNMSTELADFETRVNDYLNSVMLMFNIVNSDTVMASSFINGDTLTLLGDLSIANAALADSLNRYALAVNTLAPNTNTTVLSDSVYSMLRLAADISLMGNRIVEMGDNISIMADNIGLMSLRIVDTQNLQLSNLDMTQANLSAAQITTISVISAYGL